MVADVSRKFSTGDTVDDFVMDFVTYKMHAKFGNIAGENDTAFRFNEIDVNFNAFTQPENTFANFGYGFSTLGALVSVFAMLS